MTRRTAWMCGALLLAGCKPAQDEPAASEAGSNIEAPPAIAVEPEPPPPLPPPEPPDEPTLELVAGPATGASEEARADAVLAVLGDGRSAAALPLLDADPDVPFDPELARKLTPRVPVSPPTPTPTPQSAGAGSGLDSEVIRRVVRAHVGQVRSCYEQALQTNPDASGRVQIAFAIGADGSVVSAKVASSTFTDAKVGTCIADRVERWTFPRPPGGKPVKVTYPFTFEPG